jgi:aminoglycoside 6'-N-acetyltransferase
VTLDSVVKKYGPLVRGEDTTKAFVVLLEEVPIGYIQSYRLDDEPAWRGTIQRAIGPRRAAGIDYFIGSTAALGRGLGTATIAAFVDVLFETMRDVDEVVVAVQQGNVHSWRAGSLGCGLGSSTATTRATRVRPASTCVRGDRPTGSTRRTG